MNVSKFLNNVLNFLKVRFGMEKFFYNFSLSI